jgi:peptidoglycan hydrolase CwlO-like protein
MILEIIIAVLGLLVVTFGYTTFNLLRKNEHAEDIIDSQEKLFTKLDEHLTFAEKRIEQLDEKNVWREDDEIGWFFNEIKKLQKKLSQFRKNNL